METSPLHWELSVLAAGPPGTSPEEFNSDFSDLGTTALPMCDNLVVVQSLHLVRHFATP